MSPTIFLASSTRSTTLVVSTPRWAISARSSSRISIPGRWSNPPPDSCPPQGAHSSPGCNLERLETGDFVGLLCEALDLHVAVLRLPVVVLLHEHGADETDDGLLVWEDADDVGPAFHLLVQSLQRIGAVQLGAMLRGEGHVGQHVVFGLVHQPAELFEPGPQLIGNMPPDLARRLAIGLDEGLADCGSRDGLLRLGNISERIAHEVHAATLPARANDALGGGFQPLVRVGDHQLDAAQATLRQALQEAGPEGLGFRRANAEPDDLAPSFGVGGHSDYRGDRDDASALAHLQVGRIQPQIGPVAFKRTFKEGLHPLVDLLAELRDLALRDAGKPHRLRDLVDPARRHPADPGLLD